MDVHCYLAGVLQIGCPRSSRRASGISRAKMLPMLAYQNHRKADALLEEGAAYTFPGEATLATEGVGFPPEDRAGNLYPMRCDVGPEPALADRP